jgi:hypothetical protein
VNDAAALKPVVTANEDGSLFTVEASTEFPTAVMQAFGYDTMSINVTATVEVMAGAPACILGLNKTEPGAVTITGNADFLASDCVVYSNSSDKSGMLIQGSAEARADGFCSAGGVRSTKPLLPTPKENCATLDDPFAGLPAPVVGSCNHTNKTVGANKTEKLSSGVYCGGLDLRGTVTLDPGIYVIKNGPLKINSQAAVSGKGIVFYMTGTDAGFDINGGDAIDIHASSFGVYRGILLMLDGASNPGGENKLNGNSGGTLVGAIYAPTQKVTVNGTAGFGQNSPFMPIIADQVKISGNATVNVSITETEVVSALPQTKSGVRIAN